MKVYVPVVPDWLSVTDWGEGAVTVTVEKLVIGLPVTESTRLTPSVVGSNTLIVTCQVCDALRCAVVTLGAVDEIGGLSGLDDLGGVVVLRVAGRGRVRRRGPANTTVPFALVTSERVADGPPPIVTVMFGSGWSVTASTTVTTAVDRPAMEA